MPLAMVTISRSNSLESMTTTTGKAYSSHPLPKTAGSVSDSGRRQRSFTSMFRSLASKFTSSHYSVPAALTDAEGGSAPVQGPITWEEAMEEAIVEVAARIVDDYDDDGDLPAELISMMSMRPSNEIGGEDKVIRSITQLKLQSNEGTPPGEWVEL